MVSGRKIQKRTDWNSPFRVLVTTIPNTTFAGTLDTLKRTFYFDTQMQVKRIVILSLLNPSDFERVLCVSSDGSNEVEMVVEIHGIPTKTPHYIQCNLDYLNLLESIKKCLDSRELK